MKRRRRKLNEMILNVVGLLVILSMVLGGLLTTVIGPSRSTPTPFSTRPRRTIPLVTPTPLTEATPTHTTTATATPSDTPLPRTTVTPTTTSPPTATTTATSTPTDAPTPTATVTPTTTLTPTVTPTTTATLIASAEFTPIPLGDRNSETFTFAVCGDSRGGEAVYREILRRVEEDGAAFLVNNGDLVQSGGVTQFQAFAELMNGFPLPFFPVPGNHDSPDGQLDAFTQYSGAPAAHYSFDYGPGHFIVTDSHTGVMSSDELKWLETDLAATDRPLKMVFLHHPPFDPDGTDQIMSRGNDAFMALMQQYAVSYVFAGHIHTYAKETRDGVHYVVTGGAGAPLYVTDHPQAFYHYVRVTVNGTDVSTKVLRIEPSNQ